MKYLISLVLFGLIVQSKAQEGIFYVIESEYACFQKSDLSIENGDSFNGVDRINLNSGYLLLMHRAGILFEFKGDTLIDLISLGARYQPFIPLHNDSFLIRPEDFLKNNDPGIYQQIYYTVMSDRDKGGIKWVSPKYGGSFDINLLDKICLQWKFMDPESDKGNKIIRIHNSFDEPLKVMETGANRVILNIQDILKEGFESMIVISIHQKDGQQYSDKIALKLQNRKVEHFPNLCKPPGNAVKALEYAIHLELGGDLKSAYTYYQLAADLSDHQVYTLLLDSFSKRSALGI